MVMWQVETSLLWRSSVPSGWQKMVTLCVCRVRCYRRGRSRQRRQKRSQCRVLHGCGAVVVMTLMVNRPPSIQSAWEWCQRFRRFRLSVLGSVGRVIGVDHAQRWWWRPRQFQQCRGDGVGEATNDGKMCGSRHYRPYEHGYKGGHQQ